MLNPLHEIASSLLLLAMTAGLLNNTRSRFIRLQFYKGVVTDTVKVKKENTGGVILFSE